MTLYASDGTTVVAGPAKTGLLQHHLVPGTDKKPVHGRYYLFVKGSSPRTVKCGFTQTANARDGTSAGAPPLIPWNFFFWPSAKVFDDGEPNPNISTMEAILAKYERAYGHKPPTGVQWENAHHFRATGASWFGHCHLSARASILFEQPVDAKVMAPDGASVTFTQEELEFLAAEWVGAWLTTYADFVADKGLLGQCGSQGGPGTPRRDSSTKTERRSSGHHASPRGSGITSSNPPSSSFPGRGSRRQSPRPCERSTRAWGRTRRVWPSLW